MFDGPRVPLSHPESERRVLGAMMLHPRLSDQAVAAMDAEDFARPAHQTIFRALTEIRKKGLVSDPVVLDSQLTAMGELENVGGSVYLDTLTDAVGTISMALSLPSWIEVVREKARLRALDAAEGKFGAMVHSGATAAEVAGWLSELASNVGGSSLRIVEAGDVDVRGSDTGLSTAWPAIDRKLATKGAPKGQVFVFLAREKHGKSTAMVQQAVHGAWEGRGGLYIPMADLNAQRIARRIYRMRCGYSNLDAAQRADDANLARGIESGHAADFKRAEYELRNQVTLAIDDRTRGGGTDVDDVLASVEARRQQTLKSKRPLAEFYLDYFQKLTSRHFRPNDHYAMSVYCSNQISRYVERTGLVAYVGSQITQGSEKAGTEDKTKGGGHLLEDCGAAVKIQRLEGDAMLLTLQTSRFGGMGTKVDARFNDEHLWIEQVNP